MLLCFSLANGHSLRNLSIKWVPEVRQHCPDAKLVIVGTKSDLATPATAARLATNGTGSLANEDEARALAHSIGAPYVRCSALTQQGLKNVFDTAVRQHFRPPPPSKTSLVAALVARIRAAMGNQRHGADKKSTKSISARSDRPRQHPVRVARVR